MKKEEVINQIKLLSKNKIISKRNSDTLNYYAKKHFGSWNNALNKSGFKTKKSQKLDKLKKDKDFYYLLGLLITDGHLSYSLVDRRYRLSLYTSYKEEKELIIKLIKNMFNYKPGVYLRSTQFSKNKNYDIYINSKYLCEKLIKIGFPIGNRIKSNYNALFNNIPKKRINSFMRGVIDGDGSISKSMVRIHSGSENFLINTKKLLNKLNINSGNIRKDITSYTLTISTKENLLNLFKVLDYRNPHYPRKLKNWNTNIFKYYKMPFF